MIWTATGGRVSNGFYTAPVVAGTYRVRAAAQADTSKFPDGIVNVVAVTVAISPTKVTLTPLGTQQFTATVTGINNTGVTWTTSGGSVTSTGFYTAPDTAGTFSVTVISVADPSKKASANVTVTYTLSGHGMTKGPSVKAGVLR